MSSPDSANIRPVVQRLASAAAPVAAERLVERLGRWTGGDGTLAERLARAIVRLVDEGELRPGDRLPPERALAAAVSVSRGTVVAAYAALSDDGVLERRQGSGTRVSGSLRVQTAPRRSGQGDRLFSALPSAIDMLRAVPRMPDLAARVVRAHAPWADADVHALAESDPAGLPALRSRIARLFEEEGTSATAAQVLVTHGGQQAINLLVDELVAPGDVVLTEALTWPGLADSVRRRGGRVHGVRMGADGVDVDELEAAIVSLRPALVALNPHHHNPTGSRLPPAGRLRVAELSAEYGVPVIEDRVLAHISFDGVVPPTLAASRPDAPIIVVDSLSKWAWPGLRIGWVRADPALIRRLRSARQIVDSSTSVPGQLLALELIDEAPALRAAVSRTHARAADALLTAVREHLPGWSVVPPRGGLAVWARLPAGSATAFAHAAAMNGVAVAGGTEFMSSQSSDDHIRLPYTLPDAMMREAVERLGETWARFSSRL